MNLYICSGNSGDRPAMLRYLDGLDAKLRAKVILELAMLARTPFGLLVEPHVKHFSLEKYRELYELRAKGKDMVRIIFTRLPGEKILLLYPFTKKQSRDTEKALESARKLLENVRAGHHCTMELPIHELGVRPP